MNTIPNHTSFKPVYGHLTNGKCSPTYYSWKAMRRRCNDPKYTYYYLYGGRGISYDNRWNNFTNFLLDMGERPEGKTLDRQDANKNYCKDNCMWATPLEQRMNQRRMM